MKIAVRLLLYLIVLQGMAGCTIIPRSPEKLPSYSRPPATQGMLAQHSKVVLTNAKPDESAFMLISNNEEALRWRLAVIDSAIQSIDLQVYIWSNDESGRLIAARIMAAARRGVQVRMLVDDMPKDFSDHEIAYMAGLTNIQLRRFNPGRIRKGLLSRAFQMSTQFRTLNRRMHNKQMIVDGNFAIIGGRNIGNPYFGLSKKYNNRDLDVLITGNVIEQMADSFDEYWNSDAAYPGEAMAKAYSKKKIRKELDKLGSDTLADRRFLIQTSIPLLPIDWNDEFQRLPGRMITGTAQCFHDDPAVKGDRGIRLKKQVIQANIPIQDQSCLISPYLIPSKERLDSMANAIS